MMVIFGPVSFKITFNMKSIQLALYFLQAIKPHQLHKGYQITPPLQISIEKDYTTLEIREVYPEDVGEYTLVLRNLAGESRSTCRLDMEKSVLPGSLSKSHEAPRLVSSGLSLLMVRVVVMVIKG